MSERLPMEDDFPDDYNPTAVIMAGLTAASKGESYDEDAVQEAALVLAAAVLMSRGLDFDTATRAVDQAADGDIHIKWSEIDGLSVTIGSDDE